MLHPRLQAQGLGRTLGDRVLFADVELDVSGGLLWIRGPSGAGKSELLRRVAGLVPGAGVCTLDGERSGGMPAWRAQVVLVGQQPPQWEGTARQAAARIASLTQQRSRPTDDPIALTSRWRLPEDRWDQPMGRLSGGEAQRIWLALVLARRPSVVLLDEPTSALDPETTLAVEADLVGRTGLLVTHDAAQGARLAARSWVLG